MIELKNVSKTFAKGKEHVKAVDNVSLSIKDGEIYGIIGFSGAGKSTLVRCINLLEKPDCGEVIVDNIDLMKLKEEELRKILQEFIDLDYKVKSGAMDINIGLESILCRYCS